MYCLTRSLRWCTLFVLLFTLSVSLAPAAVVYATGPCAQVAGDPGDPGIGTEPDLAGIVTDLGVPGPVSGATMQLYRCNQGEGTYVSSVTTNSSGHYEFWSLSEAFYYVEAALSGPLAGKTPAAGTTNPSVADAVGPGDRSLDFSFQ